MSVLEGTMDYSYENFSGFSNNSNETLSESFENPQWARYIVQVLYAIVCIVGLGGNTLVIYVVVRFSKMQTVTNLYIVNLAIADELFLIGIPFLISTMNLGYWPFGKIACKVYYTTTSINQITSSMFLLIMSADRYLAVCHPIRAPKWRTPLIAKLVALTAWTISALIMVPTFMYANTLVIQNKTNCNIFWPESSVAGWSLAGSTIFIVYSFFLGFFVPFILILVFYLLVICRLRTVGPKRRSASSSTTKSVTIESSCQRNRDRKKSHRKVTKLVLTVITVYFVCWFPFWITQIQLLSTPQEEQHSGMKVMMFLLAGCLSYSNSAMNPILYAFLSDNFKKSFLKACTCANRKDANAVLHIENSIFPRHNKASTRDHSRKPVPIQPKMNELTVPKIKQDSDDDENPVVTSESRPLTSRSALSDVSKVTQETFIQDGIHMTSL